MRDRDPNETDVMTEEMDDSDDDKVLDTPPSGKKGKGRKIPQHRLKMGQEHSVKKGGSWSQPPWRGWHPIIGAGGSPYASFHPWQTHPMGYMGSGHVDYFQKYAQDGDSGFFHTPGGVPSRELAWSEMAGGAEPAPRGLPVGISPFPPNRLQSDLYETRDDSEDYEEPQVSTIVTEHVEPDLDPEKLEVTTQSAEHQQRATYVPPYSQMTNPNIREGNVLYEEPLVIKKYEGGFHKKKGLGKR